jgi:hypothetical protein
LDGKERDDTVTSWLRGLWTTRNVVGVVLVVILIVSAAGVARSVLAAREVTASPSLGYKQTGEFDYSATLKPSTLYGDRKDDPRADPFAGVSATEEKPKLVFMRGVINDFDMYYHSAFGASEPLAWHETTVTVSIYVENPDYWRKQAQQYVLNSGSDECELSFSLDAEALQREVEQVDTDVGFQTSTIDLQIEAAVRVQGATSGGEAFDEEFRHTLDGVLEEYTIELTGRLDSHEERSVGSLVLDHTGRFDYAVWLYYNDLYDEPVLRSEPLPVAEAETAVIEEQPPVVVGPGSALFPSLVDALDMRYYYTFDTESPVERETHDVSVVAVIENPGTWRKEFPLAREQRTESFGISFVVPIADYVETIEDIERETAVVSNEYNLSFTALVETTAETGMGAIGESFVQTLSARLSGNTLVFGGELMQSVDGRLGGEEVPVNPGSAGWATLWWIGVALGGGGVLLWLRGDLPGRGSGALERSFLRELGKYRGQVLDVPSVPGTEPHTVRLPVASIDQLGHVSEVVMKPMIHVQEDGLHRLFVIDGDVRYEFVLGGEPAPGEKD